MPTSKLALRCALASSAASVLVAATGVAAGAQATPTSGDLVQLGPGTTQLELHVVHPLGPADPAQPLTVAVEISNPALVAAAAYQRHMVTAGDPLFGHTLSRTEIARRFSADPQRTAALTGWLRQGGFTVAGIGDTGDTVWVSGTVAQAEALFHVSIDRFRNRGLDFIANTAPPSVPRSLGVVAVVGLNTAHRSGLISGTLHATPSVGPPGTPGTNLTPQDMWSIYDLPAGNLGQGQTMGVLAWGNTEAQSVLSVQTFDASNNLRRMPITIDDGYLPHDRSDHTQDSAIGEWTLDGAASTGMSPDAVSEKYYFAPGPTDAAVSAIFDEWENRDRHAPRQVNASFGECEGDPALFTTKGLPVDESDSMEAIVEPILMKATMQGRTLFTSTGDTGSGCPILPVDVNGLGYETGPWQGYPAASAYSVAVGGTSILTNGDSPATRDEEIAWPYTGGGPSNHIEAPPYQNGVSNIAVQCVTQPDGTPYASPVQCRGLPDVAADADGLVSPYAGNGGTSLASPLWMGMWTRIQAAQPDQAAGTSFADPLIYKWAQQDANAFFDIQCCTNVPYPALPGWDYTSGWGAPDLTALMRDIDGRTAPLSTFVPPGAPLPASLPGVCSGTDVVTDQSGDASVSLLPAQENQGTVDITGVSFAVDAAAQTLTTTLGIANLTQLPAGGTLDTYYNVVFNLPDGKTYATQVVQPDPAALTFAAGPYDPTSNQFVSSSAETGTVNPGSPGTIVVTAKLADIGSPSPSASPLVSDPYAVTMSGYGVLGAGLILTAPDDRAPDSGYGHPWPVCPTSHVAASVLGTTAAGSGSAHVGLPNTAGAVVGGPGGALPVAAGIASLGWAGRLRRRRRREAGFGRNYS
jgi:pseudomonalisin